MIKSVSLVVDGSTYAGTVAVLRDNEVVAESSLPDSGIPAKGQRGEDFMPMVAQCLARAGIGVHELARVICGSGPGSFTSLRIAASIAKGIAVGAGCPLYSVSSLLLITAGTDLGPGRYLSVMPAMRGESFVLETTVDDNGGIASIGDERIVATSEIEDVASSAGLIAIGRGVGRDLRPLARGAARLMDQIIGAGECDLDTWEPTYGRLAEAQVKWEAAHGRPLALDV